MTKIVAGKFYGETDSGTLVEIKDPAREPDVWVCRRVEDFPNNRPPVGCKTDTCCLCDKPIVYNPARQVKAPKSCMQCNRIKPDPWPY